MDNFTIEILLETVRQRDRQIDELLARVSALEAELAIYKNRKNSNNSHTPPSRDENRPAKKNQSLRTKTDKQAGGQPGHEGKTLDCTIEPDSHRSHMPGFCSCCGNDLAAVPEVLTLRNEMGYKGNYAAFGVDNLINSAWAAFNAA